MRVRKTACAVVKSIVILVLTFNINVKAVIDMKLIQCAKPDSVESVVEPAGLGLFGRGETWQAAGC